MERYHNFGGEALTRAAASDALAVLEVNAPVVDHPGSPKALVDRALLIRADAALARAAGADGRSDRHARARPSCRRAPRATEFASSSGAPTPIAFIPAPPAPLPFERPRPGRWRCSPARFAPGTARSTWSQHQDIARGRLSRDRSGADRRRPGVAAGPRRSAQGCATIVFTGALPHEAMPAALSAADIGVAPFESSAHAPLWLGFYWSPLKIFEYMAAGLPVVAPSIERIPHAGRGRPRGSALRSGQPGGAGGALRATDAAPRCARSSAPPLAPVRCATTAGRRIAARSTRAFRGRGRRDEVPR